MRNPVELLLITPADILPIRTNDPVYPGKTDFAGILKNL
jgi:hypothetical protein